MRKNSLKRNTFSPLTRKIKAPQHLLRLEEGEQDEFANEWSGHFQLPSLPRRKSWKDDIPSNGNSVATSVSWSQEAEDVATQRVEVQWTTVERSFYEEDDQLSQGTVLDECVQWRTQIPYLRIIGRNLACPNNIKQRDLDSNDKKLNSFDNLQNNEVFMEHSLSTKEKKQNGEEDSTQYKLNKAKFEDILDILMEYVISMLFPDEENDTDSLSKDLSDVLKIAPASIYSSRNSSRSSKTNWAAEVMSLNYMENKSLSIKNRLLDAENFLQTIKNDSNHLGAQKKHGNSISADKQRDSCGTDDGALRSKDRLCTPHIGRNKLGTVFNERIVVSPVPFAISTRESFSTLKTAPIRFMGENLEISSFQGFRNSVRKSSLRTPDIHSTWQAPVCPTVWPKNVRLAPIDAPRLPSNRNRSLAPSPAILHCSRRPLSPISRPAIPKSAHATCDRNDILEIQGKHIVSAQSSKINLLSAGFRATRNKKKKPRAKEGS